ncbi:erythromycin esterase family protein [Streptomyces sp. NPDC086549]|uniref:erythromycin esterase family protein n=1 Tax=Streptomyces sp. NPDC086549 TaxID=3365752 RepID=UPI00381DF132
MAALAVNDYVQEGVGTLDAVMSEGFSHGFGELDSNRQLVPWMREFNESRPAEEQLAFHGFDTPTENTSAPSPRGCLEYARDYLELDLDLASLVGADELWSRSEAVMHPTMSIGATAEAERLRSVADDMLASLYARAPELIAATSRAEWHRAETHLTAGLGLLRYHRQCAQRLEQAARLTRLLATRDALMARNLLDIRNLEAERGPTLVFAHNLHLLRNPSTWRLADTDLNWSSAGAIVGSLVGERYRFVAGSLGHSGALGLREPEPDTYEGFLQRRITTWGLTAAGAVASARKRTDTTPRQGYFPLDRAILDGSDAVLHISAGTTSPEQESRTR